MDAGTLQFQGAEIKILPDLSRATLQRRAVLRPLLNVIRSKGCTYRWGYPFHLIVRKGAQSFALQHVEDIPQLFEFLETDPIAVSDWLAPVPLPPPQQRQRRTSYRGSPPHRNDERGGAVERREDPAGAR